MTEPPIPAGTIVIVRDAATSWVVQTTASIRSLGYEPALLTTPLSPAEREVLDPVLDRIVELDVVNHAEVLIEQVHRLSAQGPVVGLFTVPDTLILPVNEAAGVLGLPRCPSPALAAARHKHVTRAIMRDAGLPTPRFSLIHSAAEAADVAEAVGLPAVIKPVNGSASTLVRRVATAAELEATYRLIAERLPDSGQYAQPIAQADGTSLDPRASFLVESVLDGHEYCVDVIVRDGVIDAIPVVDKALIDERFFEIGFVYPAFDTPAERLDAIQAAAVDAVRAIGLDNCVSHVEVIDDATLGPVVIEVNAGRPGGQVLALLNQLISGVDLFTESVALAVGAPPPPREHPTPGLQLATLTLFAEGGGRLAAIHGLDALADLPEVLRVLPGASVGDMIDEDSEVYAVNLLVGGFLDLEDLRAIHAEATALVRLELEPLEADVTVRSDAVPHATPVAAP